MTTVIEKHIDKLTYGIYHASVAISNHQQHSKAESEFWIKEYERLKKEKEILLKGVFGI